jgi:hypothetical protein
MQEELDTLSVGERREIFLQNIFEKENYRNMLKSNKLDSLPWSNINASKVVVYSQLEMCLATIAIIDLNPYVLLDEDDPNVWMEYDNGDRVSRKTIPCEFSDFNFYKDIAGHYIVEGSINGERFKKEYSLE